MKLVYVGNFMAILLFVLFIMIFFSIYAAMEPLFHQTRFLVKVPLPVDKNLSSEEQFWRNKSSLFPQTEIPRPIPKGLPNDDTFLVVLLEKTGKIKINSEKTAEITNTKQLTDKLGVIFAYRKEMGVFEENSREPVRAVIVKSPRSEKYGNVVKVIDAVKESGADPIVLQIDDLPQ